MSAKRARGTSRRRQTRLAPRAVGVHDLLGAVGMLWEAVRDRRPIFDKHFAGHGRAAVRDVADTIAGQITHPEADTCIYKGALTVSSESGANCLIRKAFPC
jgi:hypothetical protein